MALISYVCDKERALQKYDGLFSILFEETNRGIKLNFQDPDTVNVNPNLPDYEKLSHPFICGAQKNHSIFEG